MKNTFKKMMALGLMVAMVGTTVVPAGAASSDPNASAAREAANSAISQKAATQGSVLLDNAAGALPISGTAGTKVALFGYGVYNTVKGGTGSGDVYLKDGANINVYQGFQKAGYDIVNSEMVDALAADHKDGGSSSVLGATYDYEEGVYADNETYAAAVDAAAAETDTAIYVLTRNSGEGADRTATEGDYYLLDSEYANLTLLASKFDKVIVLLNVGGIIDTNFYNGLAADTEDNALNRNKIEGLDALVLMSQGGQNSGPAIVQNLNGEVNFSGKLTDTWAVNYEDYPGAETIANTDGNTLEEVYDESIYVGYRKFDSFNLPVAYAFGYGDSYTDFSITVDKVKADASQVTVTATVKNTGAVAGKEVVEVYFSAPAGTIDKPYQELAGYAKTGELAPGKSQTVTVTYDTADMSSYDEAKAAYVLEDGNYLVRVGNSSRNTEVAATIKLDKDVITEQCQNNLDLTKADMENGTAKYGVFLSYEDGKATYNVPTIDVLDAASEGYTTNPGFKSEGNITAKNTNISVKASKFTTVKYAYQNGDVTTYVSTDETTDSAKYAVGKEETSTSTLNLGVQEKDATETIVTVDAAKSATLADVKMGLITVEQLVADMSTVELADLVIGSTYNELNTENSAASAIIGNNAATVYGAAGESTSNLYASRVIPNIVFSDGPAGIRITNEYTEYYLVGSAAYEEGREYYSASYGWAGYSYKKLEITNEEELRAAQETYTVYTTDNVQMYQYCTAFPIGTMLAQTWDVDLIEEVGRAIGVEMLEYGVTSFLAPGMNIHRNPMCGRNFEYHSEDPLVSGLTAAYESLGISTDEAGNATGIDVTLKHFAFNNQESSRMGSNSIVTERTAREIYLKQFETAIRTTAKAGNGVDYVMSSYNMVNGTSTFLNYGLLTSLLRDEWNYEGFVMTDWYSVWGVRGLNSGKNTQSLEMIAGNDHEEPGSDGDVKNIISAIENGDCRLGDLQKSAINMLNVLIETPSFLNAYNKLVEEDPVTQAKVKLAAAIKTGSVEKILLAEIAVAEAQGDYETVAAKYKELAEYYKKLAKKEKAAKEKAEKAQKKAEEAKKKAELAYAKETFGKVTPKFASVKLTKGAVTVTMKKVSGATYYQYKIGSKSKATTKNTIKITGLKKGSKYTLKVRAYKRVNGTKVYTKYATKKFTAK